MSIAEVIDTLRVSYNFAALSIEEYLLLLNVRQAGLANLDRFHKGASLCCLSTDPRKTCLTSKSNLRESFGSYSAPDLDNMTVWWKTTSGTSGRPVSIPYDASFYLDFKFGAFHKAWYLRRGEVLDKKQYLALVITDVDNEPASISVDPLFSSGVVARLPIDVSNPNQVQSVLHLIETLHPDIISTKPSVLAALVAMRLKLVNRPSIIFVGGAALSADLRLETEQWIGDDIVSVYAISEVGVVASECSYGRMHIYESDVEVTDSHMVVPSEIIVTNRNNKALPLIGYRTGDTGTISFESCECGSSWCWIENLYGRVVPLFRFLNGEVFSPTRFNSFIRKFPLVREFQVTLKELRELEVRVEYLQAPDPVTEALMRDYFLCSIPSNIFVKLIEHRFGPNEKFSRYRIIE